jgi:asparagine synthase (glutamine-hydrolysing)
MCGIVGLARLAPGAVIDPAIVRRMNDTIRHRGPDGSGEYFNDGIGMAMRRLSIQDVEGGGQPIYNEAGTVAVVFNGEIYNYPELYRKLSERGHKFATKSDTEVLVHLYEEKGPALVNELNGMFAFALWDRTRNRLILARDRIGEKPLYYSYAGGVLAFASELKSLRTCPGVSGEIDPENVLRALSLQYVPAPGTPYLNIRKLPPGHNLVVEDGKFTVHRYWRLPASHGPSRLRYADAVAELVHRLEDSVRARLISDVPLGALLSGGIDSSAVVALMARKAAGAIKTFTVRFASPGGEADALCARQTAQMYECEHEELFVDDDAALGSLDAVLDSLDELVLDPACLPTYLVCKLARNKVTVVLSGEGGDEAFAGYARYRLERMGSWPAFLFNPAANLAFRAGLISTRSAKALYALSAGSAAGRHAYAVGAFAPLDYALITGRDAGWTADGFGPRFDHFSSQGPLNRVLATDMETWLADDLLPKVDLMSMAASLEARTPFLDHGLLEWALGLPAEFKLTGRTHKRILKDAVGSMLPPGLAERRKIGFEPPWGEWFRGRLAGRLEDALASEPFRKWEFINHAEVAKLVERNAASGKFGLQLYCLFALAEWGRRHAARH